MKHQVTSAVVLLWLGASSAAQSIRPEPNPEDVAAIRDLVAARTKDFNERDAAAMGKLFVKDADFVAANAYWWRNRDEIEQGLQMAFNTIFSEASGSTLSQDVEKLRFLTPEIAVVHVWLENKFTDPTRDYTARGTRVVVKKSGTWRFIAFHNSHVEALPEGAPQLPGIQRREENMRVLGPPSSPQGAPDETREEDKTAIRELLASRARAFNEHDASAVAALYAIDADFVNAAGYWWRGRNELEKVLHMLFEGPFATASRSATVEKIKFLAPHVAVMQYWLEGRFADSKRRVAARGTAVVVEQGGQWRFVAVQQTHARPWPEDRPPLPGILHPDKDESPGVWRTEKPLTSPTPHPRLPHQSPPPQVVKSPQPTI